MKQLLESSHPPYWIHLEKLILASINIGSKKINVIYIGVKSSTILDPSREVAFSYHKYGLETNDPICPKSL